MSSAAPQIAHNIDRLVVNGRRVFGWGWTAHPSKAVTAVHLRVTGDGGDVRIPADYGLPREDVDKTHPSLVGAHASGFIVSGFAKSGDGARVVLVVDFDDGTTSAGATSGFFFAADSAERQVSRGNPSLERCLRAGIPRGRPRTQESAPRL